MSYEFTTYGGRHRYWVGDQQLAFDHRLSREERRYLSAHYEARVKRDYSSINWWRVLVQGAFVLGAVMLTAIFWAAWICRSNQNFLLG